MSFVVKNGSKARRRTSAVMPLPLSKIKLLTTDPEEQDKAMEEIRRKYAEYFGT